MSELFGIETTIGYGGIIGRAENKAMIKVLGIKMRRTSTADFKRFDLLALLDTQPEVGNHCVPFDRTPDIVLRPPLPPGAGGAHPRVP
jgi:nanoRNase/pAp phosphatase (c-di-AMP/oligoRNAs hydrolase)